MWGQKKVCLVVEFWLEFNFPQKPVGTAPCTCLPDSLSYECDSFSFASLDVFRILPTLDFSLMVPHPWCNHFLYFRNPFLFSECSFYLAPWLCGLSVVRILKFLSFLMLSASTASSGFLFFFFLVCWQTTFGSMLSILYCMVVWSCPSYLLKCEDSVQGVLGGLPWRVPGRWTTL